ncbi:sterol glucosyltransferase [Colletotrichum tofieldiae]|nr:sterol glucosyltransferase [Colletotrichum tofieldiae]GKT76744.1 sterol glucosyltransferase [Colletotrichum tofieldiae]
MRDYWQLSGPFGLAVRAAIRIFQFIFSIVTIGLYAASLASWDPSRTNVKKTNWIFALVPAVISALTCAYHVFATVTHAAWSVWDFCLAVLWAALCGVSSSLVVSGEDGNNVTGDLRTRLAAGAWIAGVSMILWLLSAIHGCAYCCASRKTTRIAKQEGDKVDLEELPNRQQQNV